MKRMYIGFVAALMALACTTTEEQPEKESSKTHYTLELGKRTSHQDPLPEEIQILVNWFNSEGSKRTVEGFRGWDFDRDGRFEMVEVLNEDGTTQAFVFDFDGDGTIDAIKRPDASMAVEHHPKPLKALIGK